MELKGYKLLVTGPTSQVALPIVEKLAAENQVYGLARFSKDADRERVEAAGATPVKADMGRDDLSGIPEDIDYVLHFAVVKTGDFEYDLQANAVRVFEEGGVVVVVVLGVALGRSGMDARFPEFCRDGLHVGSLGDAKAEVVEAGRVGVVVGAVR